MERIQKSQTANLEIDFNKCPACYWNQSAKISYLQRFVIIHSLLYYEFDESIIPDTKFDVIAKQLYKVQKEHKDSALKSLYYYALHDFNGSTMFNVVQKLNRKDYAYLTEIALKVLKMYKEEKSETF